MREDSFSPEGHNRNNEVVDADATGPVSGEFVDGAEHVIGTDPRRVPEFIDPDATPSAEAQQEIDKGNATGTPAAAKKTTK